MSITTKEQTVRDLEDQLAAARADLDKARSTRTNQPEPGSKVLITATFPSSDKVYEYLALRKDEPGDRSWYVTGQQGAKTWDEVIRLVDRAEYTVSIIEFTPLDPFTRFFLNLGN